MRGFLISALDVVGYVIGIIGIACVVFGAINGNNSTFLTGIVCVVSSLILLGMNILVQAASVYLDEKEAAKEETKE